MTAIDRTAYPRPGSRLTREELRARYTLTETDLAFIRLCARGETGRLMLATLLKARQDLGYFPAADEIHADTTGHLAQQLGLTASVSPAVTHKTKSLYRYQAAVRSYLSVTHYDDVAEGLVTKTILETAETMSDPADLINQAVETLQAAAIDLPAFSTLDRLVNRLRAEVHARIYNRVLARVTPEHLAILDTLLVRPANAAVCIPQSVTLGQVMHVTVLYLDQHPARLDAPFLALARWALIEAWPCKPADEWVTPSKPRVRS